MRRGPSAARAPFALAFDRALRTHEPNIQALLRDLLRQGLVCRRETLQVWRTGQKAPGHARSLAILGALERRWLLPTGYFRRLLTPTDRAVAALDVPGVTARERRAYLWHLPEDFGNRSPAEREEILAWIRRTFEPGATTFRRFSAAARAQPFALRFPDHHRPRRGGEPGARAAAFARARRAPAGLCAEMADLLGFKTATFAPADRLRLGVWSAATVDIQRERFGLLFGALAAASDGPVGGLGIPPECLTFGLLLLPQVWDAYLAFRHRRRGFFGYAESDMLRVCAALTHPRTGWLSQTPGLAANLRPVEGLVSDGAVQEVRRDWAGACARTFDFLLMRRREIVRLARRHRDPFEPILPVLEAENPLAEYLKIATEIAARRPCPGRQPLAAAENVRAYLMVRLALHLGFRARTLREMLVRSQDEPATPAENLDARGCGELRWDPEARAWEVFAPPSAFKNWSSSYFSGQPYRSPLPDVGGLYRDIEAYVAVHRPMLLAGRPDPETFFVKSPNSRGASAAYTDGDFYAAWRALTARYGVYNPYTGRGAIRGLLPHGPHCVRDVLATHVLKLTGSFEEAGYVIQDTGRSVQEHYGHLRPQDKATRAARLLSTVWGEPSPPGESAAAPPLRPRGRPRSRV